MQWINEKKTIIQQEEAFCSQKIFLTALFLK